MKYTFNEFMAAKEFYYRQQRLSHPDGHFDNAGRWYPSDKEMCPCCHDIRTPSRSFPYSLMNHCRTLKHIKTLFNVEQKNVSKLLNELKEVIIDEELYSYLLVKLGDNPSSLEEIKSYIMEKRL